MPIGSETYAYRRRLPHLFKPGKTLFVTCSTQNRRCLGPQERSIALSCCVHDHLVTMFLSCAVVMSDHMHLILLPFESYSLKMIMKRIKGVSSRLINKNRGSQGTVWQHESFDHMLRTNESLAAKAEYLCSNPVRAGLVSRVDDYPWIWREWVEGRCGAGNPAGD